MEFEKRIFKNKRFDPEKARVCDRSHIRHLSGIHLELLELLILSENGFREVSCGVSENAVVLERKIVVLNGGVTGEEHLEGVEVEIVNHECEASVLAERFPEGYHELEDEVYSELTYIPAQFKVLEHHIKIYAGNHDNPYRIEFTRKNDNPGSVGYSYRTACYCAAVRLNEAEGTPIRDLIQAFYSYNEEAKSFKNR